MSSNDLNWPQIPSLASSGFQITWMTSRTSINPRWPRMTNFDLIWPIISTYIFLTSNNPLWPWMTSKSFIYKFWRVQMRSRKPSRPARNWLRHWSANCTNNCSRTTDKWCHYRTNFNFKMFCWWYSSSNYSMVQRRKDNWPIRSRISIETWWWRTSPFKDYRWIPRYDL